jgi:hypothetical protein
LKDDIVGFVSFKKLGFLLIMCLVSLVDNSLIGKLSVILIRELTPRFLIVLCSTSFSFNPKVGTAFSQENGTVFMQPVFGHCVHKGGK